MRLGVRNKDDIKRDPFFKGIDWNKMMKRQVKPPVMLMVEESNGDDDEEAFLQSRSKPVKFNDTDYTEDNMTVNRLKKYTFINQ